MSEESIGAECISSDVRGNRMVHTGGGGGCVIII